MFILSPMMELIMFPVSNGVDSDDILLRDLVITKRFVRKKKAKIMCDIEENLCAKIEKKKRNNKRRRKK